MRLREPEFDINSMEMFYHSIMVKTQIRLPDELYRRLKRVAQAKEWSMAETLRRGAELLLRLYPAPEASGGERWSPPKPQRLGWRGLSHAQVRSAALEDMKGRA